MVHAHGFYSLIFGAFGLVFGLPAFLAGCCCGTGMSPDGWEAPEPELDTADAESESKATTIQRADPPIGEGIWTCHIPDLDLCYEHGNKTVDQFGLDYYRQLCAASDAKLGRQPCPVKDAVLICDLGDGDRNFFYRGYLEFVSLEYIEQMCTEGESGTAQVLE